MIVWGCCSAPSQLEVNSNVDHMASIAVVCGWHCVSTVSVLTSTDLVDANLMIKLSACIQIPHFISSMIETELSHGQVRYYILRMHHSVVFATWVKLHYVVRKSLVTRAWWTERIEVNLVCRIQLFFDVHSCKRCQGRTKRVACYQNRGSWMLTKERL